MRDHWETKESNVRLSWRGPLAGGCVGLAAILGACQGMEEGDQPVHSFEQRTQKAEEELVDTVQSYAAKCDAATGIHVPAFSCTNLPVGPEQRVNPAFAVIDQSSSADNVENATAFGGLTAPEIERTNLSESPTAFTMRASGAGTVDSLTGRFYFAHTRLTAQFDAVPPSEFNAANLMEVTINSLLPSGCSGPDCVPQAGLMMRPNADPNSSFAMLAVLPGGRVVFKYRKSIDGTTHEELVSAANQFPLPLRLRMQWDSNFKIIAEVAPEGGDWQRFGPPIDMPDGIFPNSIGHLGGVAVAAATATYDKFYTPRKCDRPNVLNGSCNPGSTFQVVERTADAIVVANCRKGATFNKEDFGDIAVIQYNRKNGAVCFYQSPGEDLDASQVTPPSSGTHFDSNLNVCPPGDSDDPFCWISPEDTHAGGCTGCHDSSALIRSPYIMQSGLIPEQGFASPQGAALRYVGHAYADDRSWLVVPSEPNEDPYGEVAQSRYCLGCHNLATSNVVAKNEQGGTAYKFATMATTPYQYADPMRPVEPTFESKNTVSETSPTWMPDPGMRTTYPNLPYLEVEANWTPELRYAKRYRDCATEFWNAGMTDGFDPPPSVPSCEFTPYGTSFAPALGLLNAVETNIGGGGGEAEGNFDALTLTSPLGSDVYGTSDKAYTVSAIMQGDGYLVVKVTDLEDTDPYAKAGLMFRESNAPNAKNVMLSLTSQHGMQLHHRSTTGGSTTVQPSTGAMATQTFPVWLRLERAGNTVIGSISTDERNSWQRVGVPVNFSSFTPQTQAVVNTSHNANATGSAAFESFDFTPTQGWMGPDDPHHVVDLVYGSTTSTGKRREWITDETMSASGGDIYGNQDSALFSFKSFVGNGELQTIVKAFDPDSHYGKAGLMIRASGAADAANVFFGRIQGGLTFQSRSTTGGSTTSYNCENIPNLPERLMLRLIRNGTSFTAHYKSETGTTWTQLKNCPNTQNLTLSLPGFPSSALAGLAVSSEQVGATTNATFWSGMTVEPPGFLWSALGLSPNSPEADPNPETEPEPTGRPCDTYCSNAQEFSYTGSHSGTNLGVDEVCLETFSPTREGNCGNMNSRILRVNGVTMPCNTSWLVPAKHNGGYCIHVTAGTPAYAWFGIWP